MVHSQPCYDLLHEDVLAELLDEYQKSRVSPRLQAARMVCDGSIGACLPDAGLQWSDAVLFYCFELFCLREFDSRSCRCVE